MKRPNWDTATYAGADQAIVRPEAQLDESELSWLCGCGQSKPYVGSRAYPICECGQRMRLLDHARLGYRR